MSGGRFVPVMRAVAARNIQGIRKFPPKLLPAILVPLFFFASFKGALSGIGNTSGFAYFDFTTFIFVLIVYMAAMFSAVFTAIDISIDFQSGIGRRFMAAAPQRMAIVAGYVIVSLGRGVLGIAIVWGVVEITGLQIRGGALDIAGLIALALLLNLAVVLYGAGVALRFRDVSAGALINLPVFLSIFLSPVFQPRDQLSGILKTVAGLNPLTPSIEAGRGFLANEPFHVGLAFATAGGLVLFFGVFAIRGMRKAEQGK